MCVDSEKEEEMFHIVNKVHCIGAHSLSSVLNQQGF